MRKKLIEALFCLHPGKGCGQEEPVGLGSHHIAASSALSMLPPSFPVTLAMLTGTCLGLSKLDRSTGHSRCGGSRTLGSVTVVRTGEMQFLLLPGSSDTQPTLSCFLRILSPLSSLTSELSGPGTTSVVTPDNVPLCSSLNEVTKQHEHESCAQVKFCKAM